MPDESLPLVSVVVTCFNSEKYVAATIRSILANARDDLPIEVIAVNDCSTDRTMAVLGEFGAPVRVIDKPQNEGVSPARNTGISAARGQYVAFCDHDDLWEPDKLERQLQCFTSDRIGLVCSDAECFNERGVVIPSMAGRWLRRGRVFEYLLQVNFVIASSAVLRRSVFERVGMFNPAISYSEDLDLWLRVARVYEVDYVNKPLVHYRSSPSQLSKNKIEMKASRERIIRQYSAELENRALARRVVADTLYLFAMDYWYAGRMVECRSKLLEAFRFAPFNLKYPALYFASFFRRALRRVRSLGRGAGGSEYGSGDRGW